MMLFSYDRIKSQSYSVTILFSHILTHYQSNQSINQLLHIAHWRKQNRAVMEKKWFTIIHNLIQSSIQCSG